MDHVTASPSPPPRLLFFSQDLFPIFSPSMLFFSLSLSEHDSANVSGRCTCTGILCTKKKEGGRAGTGFLSILIRLPCLHFRSTIHSSGSSPSFRSIPIFLLISRSRVLDVTIFLHFVRRQKSGRDLRVLEFFSSENRDKNERKRHVGNVVFERRFRNGCFSIKEALSSCNLLRDSYFSHIPSRICFERFL